jgi:hypothetical protein
MFTVHLWTSLPLVFGVPCRLRSRSPSECGRIRPNILTHLHRRSSWGLAGRLHVRDRRSCPLTTHHYSTSLSLLLNTPKYQNNTAEKPLQKHVSLWQNGVDLSSPSPCFGLDGPVIPRSVSGPPWWPVWGLDFPLSCFSCPSSTISSMHTFWWQLVLSPQVPWYEVPLELVSRWVIYHLILWYPPPLQYCNRGILLCFMRVPVIRVYQYFD